MMDKDENQRPASSLLAGHVVDSRDPPRRPANPQGPMTFETSTRPHARGQRHRRQKSAALGMTVGGQFRLPGGAGKIQPMPPGGTSEPGSGLAPSWLRIAARPASGAAANVSLVSSLPPIHWRRWSRSMVIRQRLFSAILRDDVRPLRFARRLDRRRSCPACLFRRRRAGADHGRLGAAMGVDPPARFQGPASRPHRFRCRTNLARPILPLDHLGKRTPGTGRRRGPWGRLHRLLAGALALLVVSALDFRHHLFALWPAGLACLHFLPAWAAALEQLLI